MPKPVRPFHLISYYWEPSRFPSERNCHGIQHPRKRCGLPLPLPDAGYRAHQGNDLSYDEDYAPTDDAKDTIISAIYATFEEKYGEDFADCADNFIQDNDDIAGRVNPCAMSVETVRAVNEKGYDAVFAEQWKAELSECDIDPEAVSVDSEAHDMENGRDGLDGNAPEKDAPEKDDRDAQPPVDTDNR